MRFNRIIFSAIVMSQFWHGVGKSEIIGADIKRIASEQKMIDSLFQAQIKDSQNHTQYLKNIINNGKPTLVTLWAHWCINCLAEIKGFRAVSEKCPNEWNIVFVSARPNDYAKDIVKFNSFKLPWNIYRGPELGNKGSPEANISSAFYGLTHDEGVLTPLHYFLSKNGKVEAIVNAKFDLSEPIRLAGFCGSDK